MIIKRVSQALARQDWSTVVIEILVVVVGIFLGLQVDDWNERRKYRQIESVYLEKLAADIATMREELSGQAERFDATRQRMMAALAGLEDCTLTDTTREDVAFTLERYQVVGPMSYLSATYEEMVESGTLARIDDPVLKQTIARTFSQLADLNANQRATRVSLPIVDGITWKLVSYTVDRETGIPRVNFDLAALCDNTELRNAIVEMIDIQWDSLVGARRALAAIDELLASLGTMGIEYLGSE